MCRPFSLILTKNQTAYYHPNPLEHSHTEIMKHFKINESTQDPRFNQFVRIEISPKDGNYKSNPDNWDIKVDEHYVPSWYEDDKESYEAIIRKEAKSWLNRVKEHIPKITKPDEAYEYCMYINNGKPIKELEPIIATDAEYSYLYAIDVLDGSFELGEQIISTNASYSHFYAVDALKGKFLLGEKIIATDAYYSYAYAYYALKGRFELGEPVIKNSQYKEFYQVHFNIKL